MNTICMICSRCRSTKIFAAFTRKNRVRAEVSITNIHIIIIMFPSLVLQAHFPRSRWDFLSHGYVSGVYYEFIITSFNGKQMMGPRDLSIFTTGMGGDLRPIQGVQEHWTSCWTSCLKHLMFFYLVFHFSS
jgi:hypothetical protein